MKLGFVFIGGDKLFAAVYSYVVQNITKPFHVGTAGAVPYTLRKCTCPIVSSAYAVRGGYAITTRLPENFGFSDFLSYRAADKGKARNGRRAVPRRAAETVAVLENLLRRSGCERVLTVIAERTGCEHKPGRVFLPPGMRSPLQAVAFMHREEERILPELLL